MCGHSCPSHRTRWGGRCAAGDHKAYRASSGRVPASVRPESTAPDGGVAVHCPVACRKEKPPSEEDGAAPRQEGETGPGTKGPVTTAFLFLMEASPGSQ